MRSAAYAYEVIKPAKVINGEVPFFKSAFFSPKPCFFYMEREKDLKKKVGTSGLASTVFSLGASITKKSAII